MNPIYIHLRIHTEYSLVDGLPTVEGLIDAAVAAEMPALAITDQANLFATVKFYQAALAAGIKPIIGADCWLQNPQNSKQPFRFTLLCQNAQGYRNLTRLISRAYLEGQVDNLPTLQKNWLVGAADGLIALSGAREGDIGCFLLANKEQQAVTCLQEWLTLFPDRFYLELQRTGWAQEDIYL